MLVFFVEMFVALAVLGFGQSTAACDFDRCLEPWTDLDRFVQLTNRSQVCTEFESCITTGLVGCPDLVAINATRALVDNINVICTNANPDYFRGIDKCDDQKIADCIGKVDQAGTDSKTRCLAVGETYDCFDDYKDECKVPLATYMVGRVKIPFADIADECKKNGYALRDHGSAVQPTILSVLTCALLFVLRHTL